MFSACLPRRLSENRKPTAENLILARFFPDLHAATLRADLVRANRQSCQFVVKIE